MALDQNPLPCFVAAGEALTDLIVQDQARLNWRSQPGGSTWNVARVVARLGLPSAFAGAISNDVFGDELQRASVDAGLDMRFLQRVDRSPLLAVVHRTAPPSYFFIGDDSADLHFAPQHLPDGWSGAARWVHFGGISLAREPLAGRLADLAADLRKQGVRISYDPNYRTLMDARYRDTTLRRMAMLADVIKVSDDDLAGLFPGASEDEAFATLRSWNREAMILLTRGAAGATLHAGQAAWRAPAPKVKVADTVGAGDACIGAFLYSLMTRPGCSAEHHLNFAVAAGAAACTAAGATPPSLAAIEELMPPAAIDQ